MSDKDGSPPPTDERFHRFGQRFAAVTMVCGVAVTLTLAAVIIWAIVRLVNHLAGSC